MDSDHEELESLLLDWETGAIDDQGVEQIRQILKGDADARKHFVRLQMLSASLRLENDAGLVPSVDNMAVEEAMEAKPTRASTHRETDRTRLVPRIYVWFAAVAAMLACILGARLAYLEFDRHGSDQREIAKVDSFPGQSDSEETSSGIALVTRLVDVVWEDDENRLEVGDALVPGRFAMQSGFAQIEFFCGATVILEGPAELDLESAMLARVHRGRLRAQVPPAARGFSIDVADMKVVDLGTEFGLSVSPEGADVQVFDGEVELHRPATEVRLLSTGQAVIRDAEGSYDESEVTPGHYVDMAALESREQGQRMARFQKWRSWSEELRKDQRLIAYYTLDQQGGWDRKLKNSVEPENDELDGAIVGARRVAGRWDLKKGLEFKRPGDRVRIRIPGEYSSLTLACWVKIDSLDRTFNSLFLTDEYNQGEPHWQILNTGQMYFSVRPTEIGTRGPRDQKVLSAPFWKPSMSGKWLHLATTYDVAARKATHYLNGEVLHAETIPREQLVTTTRIGAASIGNWSSPTRPDAEFAIRNLNGSIDEFAIFAAALTADEIKEMFENGNP